MIVTPTVLVLGAGASKPVGYLTGRELIDRVVGSGHCAELEDAGVSKADFTQIVCDLKMSPPPSIDAFLERRPKLMPVGRTIIAFHLLKCENADNLIRLNDSWYPYLWHRLWASSEEFKNNRLSIVTFNYDLSLDQFLFQAISHGYGVSSDEAIELLNAIPIVHVHGTLGHLDWQRSAGRKYAAKITGETVRIAADAITIMHEAADDSPEFDRAHSLLSTAKRIYFLGFGYHDENMRRLGFGTDGLATANKYVTGTRLGYTQPERAAITSKYAGMELDSHEQDILGFLRKDSSFVGK